jgi:signal transduction histidine kinase
MVIRLISDDPEVSTLCREVLLEQPVDELAVSPNAREDETADIWIWDVRPNVPDEYDWNRSGLQLFFVRPEDVARLQERSRRGYFHILIKPVTRTTLSAVLGEALAHARLPGADAHSKLEERELMLQCLIQTNLKLQLYDQQRTNFLARAVHDFRAPLTASDGYCGLLLSGPMGPLTDDQREVLTRMHRSVKRLSRMATAMFELSVGRQLKIDVHLEKEDLRECLDQALHEVNPYLEEKKIKVTVDLQPPAQDLLFRKSQMEQLLVNVLDNACKFTPKLGAISIAGRSYFWERRLPVPLSGADGPERRTQDARQPNSYRVDIRDTGPGIPPEHLDRIFEEYASYSASQDRSAGGLGLAICKMIMERHHGRIWAETSPSGALFSFLLPFRTFADATQERRGGSMRAGAR